MSYITENNLSDIEVGCGKRITDEEFNTTYRPQMAARIRAGDIAREQQREARRAIGAGSGNAPATGEKAC